MSVMAPGTTSAEVSQSGRALALPVFPHPILVYSGTTTLADVVVDPQGQQEPLSQDLGRVPAITCCRGCSGLCHPVEIVVIQMMEIQSLVGNVHGTSGNMAGVVAPLKVFGQINHISPDHIN